MNNQTLLIALAVGAWYFLVGPGKKTEVKTPPPGSTPPQTSTVTSAGSATLGSCPSGLKEEQCSKYLSDRIGLEKEKAWAGVATEGIKQGGGLLSKIFGG